MVSQNSTPTDAAGRLSLSDHFAMLSHRLRVLAAQLAPAALSRQLCSGGGAKLDKGELKGLIFRVVDDLSGSVATTMIYLGDKLGLFGHVAQASSAGGLTVAELSAAARCHPRYVDTWAKACVAHSFMECTAAADLLPEGAGAGEGEEGDGDGDAARRFWMSLAQQEVLANEGGQFFQCGAAQLLGGSMARQTPQLLACFRDQLGRGISWAELGEDAREGIARMNLATHRDLLPGWVAAVPEAMARLAAATEGGGGGSGGGGASKLPPLVLDIGCGCGESTLSLARAFPGAEFVGIDPDPASIVRARQSMATRGLGGGGSGGVVSFHCAAIDDVAPLLGGREVAVALAYDCIHDMVDPDAALASIHALIGGGGGGGSGGDDGDAAGGGCFLWFEPHGSDCPLENREILGARMVAGIALNCVTTSMAAGGAGMGAHGCTPARAERLARRVGFGAFRHERELKGAAFRNNVYVLQ